MWDSIKPLAYVGEEKARDALQRRFPGMTERRQGGKTWGREWRSREKLEQEQKNPQELCEEKNYVFIITGKEQNLWKYYLTKEWFLNIWSNSELMLLSSRQDID